MKLLLILHSEVSKLKKRNHGIRDHIYLLLNEKDQYVISYGIEFSEFTYSLSQTMNNLLLLKHQFEEGEMNMHTMFEFVSRDYLTQLAEDDVYGYGDFCWIDFEEEEALNELPGQVIAELLYIGHTKEHLRKPFYNHLSNRYVYLAHDDGWLNKVYYRDFNDFYRMLGDVIPIKMEQMKVEKSILGLKKKKSYPSVPQESILALKNLMKEGLVISLSDCEQTRAKISIPLWSIGDFTNMDEMYDEFAATSAQSPCEAMLVFDKKTREWQVTGC